MNYLKSIRATTITAGLLLAAGLAAPAQAQAETETVRERVVVTLPNGKRIVRMVEKQVPVVKAAMPAASVDPFTVPGDDSDDSSGNSNATGGGGAIDPRILEWIGWYRASDMRADANDDGRVTAADFNAFLMLLNDDKNDDNNTDDGDGDDGNNNNGNNNNNGDGNTDDGDGNTDDGNGNTDDGTTDGPGVGWTELTPSADSMVFYVAENGDDSNDGLSPNRPLRTVAEGVRRLRDGQPDWLLLRRGDTFNEVLSSNWRKSGRSASEKMVVGAYGEGPRPVLQTGTTMAFALFIPERRAHVAITSMEFRPGVQYANKGISIVCHDVEDFLFEDLKITGYSHGMAMQGDVSRGSMKDIAVRRCIIADNAGQSHSQGLFFHLIDGLLVEDNIIDRNGWDPSRGRDATSTIFQHNVYFQRTVTGVVFRDNFTARASSHGAQFRLGAIVEGNVAWANAAAMSYGNEGARPDEPPVGGRISDNLVIEAVNKDSDEARGWGIQIQHADGLEVSRNIIANSTVGDESGFGIVLSTRFGEMNRNVLIEDNIVDDFGRNLQINDEISEGITLRNNVFSKTGGDLPLVQHNNGPATSSIDYYGNRYLHTSRDDEFQIANSQIDLPEWQSDFDPMGGSLLPPRQTEDPYVNGSVTLEDYARSIGYSDLDAFLEAMRDQRKGNWDERLTPGAIRAYFRQAFELRNEG